MPKQRKPILPYKIGICLDCKEKNKKLISKRCFEQPNFCYQDFQKERYLDKQSLKEKKPAKALNKVSYEKNNPKYSSKPKVYKIKSKSTKLAKEESIYHTRDKPEYIAKNEYCEARLQGCAHFSIDIHHKKGRGIWLRNKEYFLAVCRSCHDWIEAHPQKSKELGLSFNRLDK